MPTDPLRQPAQVLHRIVVRNYDRFSHTEGVVIFTADGDYREVEPFAVRPMSWEELGRVLLEEKPKFRKGME